MTVFFIIVFIIYFFLLFLLIVGWGLTLKTSQLVIEPTTYHLSIIIPFRNEEKHLPTLIETLRKIGYPERSFEVLLIDDHSTDNSLKLAKQLTDNLPNYKIISANSSGKKNAITQGIKDCSGEIVITTDADCELPVQWLNSINDQFQNSDVEIVIGAVRIKPTHSFFSKLQVIEFSSLIGSAAATLTLGFPTMCNGANLAYRKTTFVEVNGFDGNAHIASGDDEFLMRKVVKKFGAKSLKFLKDPNAVVATNPQESFKDFLKQRIRWASKWRHNSDDFTVVLSIFVLSFQFSWLIAIGSLFFQPWNSTILALVVVKVLTEGFFLFTISRFMRQKFYWDAFFVLQIVYPPYVIVVGIFSNVFRVSWKGRSI